MQALSRSYRSLHYFIIFLLWLREPGATTSLSSYAVRRSRQAVGACDDKDVIAPAAMLLPLPSHTRQSENGKLGREVRYSREVGNLPEESEAVFLQSAAKLQYKVIKQ